MGNIERIMLRDAISQMLADNGINRETLVEMVKENIGEKVEKATAKVLHDCQVNYDSIVREEVNRTIRMEVRECVRETVREALRNTMVSVITKDAHLGGETNDR